MAAWINNEISPPFIIMNQSEKASPLKNRLCPCQHLVDFETQTWPVLTPCGFGKAETLVQGEKMLERLRANTQDSPWSQQRMSLTVKGNKKQNKYFDSVIIFFFRTRSICCFKSLILIVNVVLCTLGMDPKKQSRKPSANQLNCTVELNIWALVIQLIALLN